MHGVDELTVNKCSTILNFDYINAMNGRNCVVTAAPGIYTGKDRGEEEDYA
jgi:hypothetical protein